MQILTDASSDRAQFHVADGPDADSELSLICLMGMVVDPQPDIAEVDKYLEDGMPVIRVVFRFSRVDVKARGVSYVKGHLRADGRLTSNAERLVNRQDRHRKGAESIRAQISHR
jgi:hypothetical protein